jgi:hypothetical protein
VDVSGVAKGAVWATLLVDAHEKRRIWAREAIWTKGSIWARGTL